MKSKDHALLFLLLIAILSGCVQKTTIIDDVDTAIKKVSANTSYDRYSEGTEVISVTYTNDSDLDMEVGDSFILEKMVDGKWVEPCHILPDSAWTLVAYTVKAHSQYSHEYYLAIFLENIEPGLYRLKLGFSVDDETEANQSNNYYVYAEFSIVADSDIKNGFSLTAEHSVYPQKTKIVKAIWKNKTSRMASFGRSFRLERLVDTRWVNDYDETTSYIITDELIILNAQSELTFEFHIDYFTSQMKPGLHRIVTGIYVEDVYYPMTFEFIVAE